MYFFNNNSFLSLEIQVIANTLINNILFPLFYINYNMDIKNEKTGKELFYIVIILVKKLG